MNTRSSAPPEGDRSSVSESATPLARAAAWLWSRQAEDGGWHSETYGLLKSGQALTPFVLHALLDVPEEVAPRPNGGVERALEFIRRHVDDDGALGRFDPDVLEYPNYSTAYALRCLIHAGGDSDKPLIERMTAYLLRQQYAQAAGFEPEHPAYGGWGFGGDRSEASPGHMDLAHTRHVLEALRAVGVNDSAVIRPGESHRLWR